MSADNEPGKAKMAEGFSFEGAEASFLKNGLNVQFEREYNTKTAEALINQAAKIGLVEYLLWAQGLGIEIYAAMVDANGELIKEKTLEKLYATTSGVQTSWNTDSIPVNGISCYGVKKNALFRFQTEILAFFQSTSSLPNEKVDDRTKTPALFFYLSCLDKVIPGVPERRWHAFILVGSEKAVFIGEKTITLFFPYPEDLVKDQVKKALEELISKPRPRRSREW